MKPTIFAGTTILAALLFASACDPARRVDLDDPDSAIRTEDVVALDRYAAPVIMPDRLATGPLAFEKNSDGFAVVRVEIRSIRSAKMRIDVRTVFRDANGVAHDVTAWKPYVLSPGELFLYSSTSTQRTTEDAQVQIRKLQ
ncbi:MAG: hypothetical protein SF028_06855 [Candidatus Sumerlaeia bacterium]|nr:hypothetical protein [Candidatus Sumerlaeia bacterium]